VTSTTKIFVDWKGNLHLQAYNEKGLTADFDAPKVHGGDETALSPMESLLSSLAACSCIHILILLRQNQFSIEDCRVEATAERCDDPPRVFTKIYLRYIFKGDLPEQVVEDAIRFSQEKYCSVGGMLKKDVPVESSYEIIKTS